MLELSSHFTIYGTDQVLFNSRLAFSCTAPVMPSSIAVCDMVDNCVGNLALYAEKLRDFCAMPFEGDFLLCCERLAREYVAEFNKPNMAVSRTTRAISHWTKPPVDWVKGNSVADVRSSDSLAAAGGVIRDAHGG
ncbi:hypothetical protein V6N11_043231 [Hibiscus sabdariffa]|uniref:Uncharacterized protein n=1 Tax=Hibiscus sabdariffa TaxID=183260 RepID=A0ABR2QZ93_9ROSI